MKVTYLICSGCDKGGDLNYKRVILINIPNHLFPDLITALAIREHIKYLSVTLEVISTQVKIYVSFDMI
jgi:hypothetical protein